MTLALRLVCVVAAAAVAQPTPGRVPKVYNALITSNQNLEPSKAYPVYQPVLHDTFAFPFQPAVFYAGDFPLNNGLFPGPGNGQPSIVPTEAPSPSSDPASEKPKEQSTEAPSPPPELSTEAPQTSSKPTETAPPPPNTQSPIPLNEFGLPPQVFPLGRIDPAFNGFNQVGPYPYPYPGFRFFDPYPQYPFFNPYANFPPLYQPLPNVLSPGPVPVGNAGPPSQPPTDQAPPQSSSQTPPPEPNDLNILNYSSKDPAIPNVPPPPLPKGGLKSDSSE